MTATALSVLENDPEPVAKRRWFRRKPKSPLVIPVVMAGYAGPNFWKRRRRTLLTIFAVFTFFYAAIFSLTGTFLLLQLLVPQFMLLLLAIWLLPDTGRAPTVTLTWLLFIFLVVVICWPNYIAIALPGMPWITLIRLTAVPLAAVMLTALSTSSRFRHDMKRIIDAVPYVWKGIVAFALLALLSIAVSTRPFESLNKFVVAQLYWTLIFFTSAFVFVQRGAAIRFVFALWCCAIFVAAISIEEFRHQALPWAGHIPSFLKIDDPSVDGFLSATSRAATGIYRAKSVFTTPLGLSEYLALSSPFIWYIIMEAKRVWVKAAAILSVPLIFASIMASDSRLGFIGFFMSGLLYLLSWGVLHWRHHPEKMLGRMIVLTYPALLLAFFIASLFQLRLHNMIWGGGATLPSTEARRQQMIEGIPMVYKAPWGHGIGRAADTLGHIGSGGMLTIDSYYLSIALEYGVIGFILYYSIFAYAIYAGGRAALDANDRETRILVPLIISLTNFALVKSVLSQESNHPIVFCMLGIIVALVYRVRGTGGRTKRVEEQLAGRLLTLPGRRPRPVRVHQERF